jgi:hypothetical protein
MTEPLKLEIGDKTVRFKALGFLIHHMAEKELCRIRREAFNDALKSLSALPAPLASQAVLEAYRDFIGTCLVLPSEVDAWNGSMAGKIFWLKSMMQAVDSAVNDAEVEAVYSQITKPQWFELDAYVAAAMKPPNNETCEQIVAVVRELTKALPEDDSQKLLADIQGVFAEKPE